MKKIFALSLVLMMLLSMAACGTQGEPSKPDTDESNVQSSASGGENDSGKQVKAAFLYDSPVGDGGWITSHDLGREAVNALDYCEATFADNVPESNGWSYMNNFAKEGYDVVFACSFGYMQDCADVAAQNPDTIFMHCSGYMMGDNMGNYFGRNYEGAYLAGMACGAVTESNILGYVAPYPIAEVIRNINAFALGAKHINPDAVVKVVWISNWYDPTLAGDAAEQLIAAGADALFHYENSPSVVQACDKRGVYSCGQHADASSYSEYCLTSSVWNWASIYTSIVESIHNGTWQSESMWWGIKEGLIDIAELNPVIPEDARNEIEAVRAALKAGDVTANPFYGEVVDQSGTVRLPEGTDASFDDLMNMDYLVSNVEGSLS